MSSCEGDTEERPASPDSRSGADDASPMAEMPFLWSIMSAGHRVSEWKNHIPAATCIFFDDGTITTSLAKDISVPRRCSYCQKMMFFKTYRCKHCRYRCHKKCAGHTQRKSHCCHKNYSGEEHWTKVLQANEVNSNVIVIPCHTSSKHTSHLHHQHADSRPCSRSKRASSARRPSTNSVKSTLGADSLTSTPRESNFFSNLYARFCQWISSTRDEGSISLSRTPSSGRRTPRSACRSRSSSMSSSRSQADLLQQLLAQMPADYHDSNFIHSLSSEDSDFSSLHHRASYSSTCSSLTITSNSTATSDCQTAWGDSLPLPGYFGSEGLYPNVLHPNSLDPSNCSANNANLLSVWDRRHTNLTFTTSCPLKTKHPSVSFQPESTRDSRTSLCATWPPSGRKCYDEDAAVQNIDETVFDDTGRDCQIRTKETELKESLGEFSISYADLSFGECLRRGRRGEIYRGKWHGDVMIHTYSEVAEAQLAEFWREVVQLSMVRHENVALFMGACVVPPHLAVVTSVRKGLSMYEQVHIKRAKMSLHSRVSVVRQIAQAMGYLHAKGVVLKKLNSKNVYLEPKVKLCLMDYSMTESKFDRAGYGGVARGHLTYVAPEMLRTLRVLSPRLVPTCAYSCSTDVYAFGTVLYELMRGSFPLVHVAAEALIWQVCNGRRQDLTNLRCSANLKNLIEQCWAQNPDQRITFTEINKYLQQNGALHKRHSSSEPERLDRSGLTSKHIFT